MSLRPLALASLVAAGAAVDAPPHVLAVWEAFKAKFGKTYHSAEHHESRFKAFLENLEHIRETNGKGLPYKLGVNRFADLTHEEFKRHLGLRPDKRPRRLPSLGVHAYGGEALAAEVDWVAKGAVTAVKDQQECGSCWAFSSTGCLEAQWQIATGNQVVLSEQQLMDCNKDNDSCDGGTMDPAFEYLETHNACTEASYAYEQKAGECREASTCDVAIPSGSITGYKDVDQSEQALMSAVQQGPVSVGIQADQTGFQLYTSGVLTADCGTDLDHGVLVVGYGKEGEVDYWKVRNSWGPSWGEHGYIRLQRGKGGEDQCGILAMPSYPLVDGDAPVPAPTPPTPVPSPTPAVPTPPTPVPSPAEGCVWQDTEAECGAVTENGQACTWCQYFETIGLCMDPSWECAGAAAVV